MSDEFINDEFIYVNWGDENDDWMMELYEE
jgi:hypothetical protein